MIEQLSFQEYQELAKRTQNPDLSPIETLCHATLGLCSELSETLDELERIRSRRPESRENASKEIGDCCWMISEMCDCLGIGFENVMLINSERTPLYSDCWNCIDKAVQSTVSLCSSVQKLLQGHPIVNDDAAHQIREIMRFLHMACDAIDVDIHHVLWLNIEKLKKRYPDGFSSERSVNREV